MTPELSRGSGVGSARSARAKKNLGLCKRSERRFRSKNGAWQVHQNRGRRGHAGGRGNSRHGGSPARRWRRRFHRRTSREVSHGGCGVGSSVDDEQACAWLLSSDHPPRALRQGRRGRQGTWRGRGGGSGCSSACSAHRRDSTEYDAAVSGPDLDGYQGSGAEHPGGVPKQGSSVVEELILDCLQGVRHIAQAGVLAVCPS